jgi:hypothetical protein
VYVQKVRRRSREWRRDHGAPPRLRSAGEWRESFARPSGGTKSRRSGRDVAPWTGETAGGYGVKNQLSPDKLGDNIHQL